MIGQPKESSQGISLWEQSLGAAAACLLAAGAVLGWKAGGAHGMTLAGVGLRWLALLLLAVVAVKRRSLTGWIFLAMLVGTEVGFDAPHVAVQLRVFSDVFLRLIKTIVAPLILATLITGIAGHGDLKSVGRMGIKSLVYFEVVTTLGLLIGLFSIHVTKAGVGLQLAPAEQAAAMQAAAAPAATVAPLNWADLVLHTFPENIAKSVAEGQILQIAVFAILFGIALAMLPELKRRPVLSLMESLADTMFRFADIVMYFAPVGVGAAMAYTVGHQGLGVMVNLGKLLLTYYGALLLFALLVLLPVMLLFRIPVRAFVAAVAEPASIAFATSASEAALPRAMEAMQAMGVPRRIVAFVIPAGYSFNMDGGAVYLTMAAIFVAQAAGMHLSWGQEAVIVLTLMLTSKGIAGVPRATLMVLMATAATVHLPAEPIFVILGIDALMDMARTAFNVVGNCLASAVVARWEGEFHPVPAEPQSVMR